MPVLKLGQTRNDGGRKTPWQVRAFRTSRLVFAILHMTWQHNKRSRQARGYGTALERLRAAPFARAGRLCQPCNRVGRVTVTREADHIIPKAKGGTDHIDQLQSICSPCQKAKTVEVQGRKVRQHRRNGLEGYPLDD